MESSGWPFPRRFAVVAKAGAVVGYTDLEFPLVTHARAAGFFEPTPAFEAMRAVFEAYRRAPGPESDARRVRRWVRERDALGLTLQDGGNLPLSARIELISPWEDGRFVVHVAIDDLRYWRGLRG